MANYIYGFPACQRVGNTYYLDTGTDFNLRNAVVSEARKKQEGGTHYKDMTIEPWDVIDTWPKEQQVGYYRGNVLKYIMRYKAKGGELDLKKANHYLEKLREVEGVSKTVPAGAYDAVISKGPMVAINVPSRQFKLGDKVKRIAGDGSIQHGVVKEVGYWSGNRPYIKVLEENNYYYHGEEKQFSPSDAPMFKVGDTVVYWSPKIKCDWNPNKLYDGTVMQVQQIHRDNRTNEHLVVAKCMLGTFRTSEERFKLKVD